MASLSQSVADPRLVKYVTEVVGERCGFPPLIVIDQSAYLPHLIFNAYCQICKLCQPCTNPI